MSKPRRKGRSGRGRRQFKGQSSQEGEVIRVRMPREGEVLGIAVQLLGYDRVRVKCADGKARLCRIRGTMKKRVWIREGDVVLVAPWDFQTDKRGDIIWRYSQGEAGWLERRGLLKIE
ncbi:MAG: translation initiation factor eIF-1A [Candidatus Odinarchaeota archaeon]